MSIIIKGLDVPKDIKAVELYFIPYINSQEIGISKPFLIKAEDIIEIVEDEYANKMLGGCDVFIINQIYKERYTNEEEND